MGVGVNVIEHEKKTRTERIDVVAMAVFFRKMASVLPSSYYPTNNGMQEST